MADRLVRDEETADGQIGVRMVGWILTGGWVDQ